MYYQVMENILKIKTIANLEEKISRNTDLLEIAKTYCEFNCDKSDEISTLFSILELIVERQKDTVKSLESLACRVKQKGRVIYKPACLTLKKDSDFFGVF